MRYEQQFKDTLDEFRDLVRLNQARVLAGEGDPKILIGGINLTDGPNFHTIQLIKMGASIVSIAAIMEHSLRPDRLTCLPTENLCDVLNDGRISPRWKPDFFWDSQFEQGHHFPVGLGNLDIPTIVSFNHAYLGQALVHAEGMFDCVIAPSKQMKPWGDTYLPWGGSWGTMDWRIKSFGELYTGGEKPVDVSCTIGTGACGKESVRHRILSEIAAIKEARPDWVIVIKDDLPHGDYFRLLAESKVSISVGTWGSPMTYRPLEIIAQEAMLLHADERAYGSTADLGLEGFVWHHSIRRPGPLTEDIKQALDLYARGHGKTAKAAVEEKYSYEAQYRRVFDIAYSADKKPKLSLQDWSRRAFAINCLTGYHPSASAHTWALTDEDKVTASICPKDRDWDVCLWQPHNPERRVRWMRELAAKKGEHREIYSRYAAEEREEALSSL